VLKTASCEEDDHAFYQLAAVAANLHFDSRQSSGSVRPPASRSGRHPGGGHNRLGTAALRLCENPSISSGV
jgi:hypothetical protein